MDKDFSIKKMFKNLHRIQINIKCQFYTRIYG
jgi:hypothetical protein